MAVSSKVQDSSRAQVAPKSKVLAHGTKSQSTQIPEEKSKVNDCFSSVIKPLNQRAGTLDPELVEAEAEPKIIKVKQGDGGDFTTIMKAIKSVPAGNNKRIIISIGPGSYQEKITIPLDKPYVTLMGDPKNMPNLTFDATAKDYGTVDNGTLTTLSNYFVGAYLNIINNAPKPDGKREGAQAVALRVSGDRSAFYGCIIFGFQDTVRETVYYGEYKCTGVGASSSGREPFTKQLTEKEAEPFLLLDYVAATKWLLPPPII
ncbi:pectinesterase PPME1-like [Hibiscus syriacus]|uniref:pectinesterase PPME1-like n=1 Tax=Hibiscus syriacus TaxID=106335 RepID=UPI001923F6C2|nr:pectinesterase PPME1-like [Hibiscus syriacus]